MLLAGSLLLPCLLASIAPAWAQTFTDCNPTERVCPSKPGLPSSTYVVDFTQGPDPANWKTIGTGSINYTELGAEFAIVQQGQNPTIETSWYFFFGRAEVRLRAANGRGIVSAIVLESDDLDEVDFEWLGSLGNEVQTNYYGKGNTTTYDREGRARVRDAQETIHIYAVDWSPEAIQWSLDGVVIRTLAFEEANGGDNFPQTPMRLKLGIWAGGDPSNPNGTIQWAGGPTDFRMAPFTMFVERVTITNNAPAISYTYGDFSGSWESIIVESPAKVGPGQPRVTAAVEPLPEDNAAPLAQPEDANVVTQDDITAFVQPEDANVVTQQDDITAFVLPEDASVFALPDDVDEFAQSEDVDEVAQLEDVDEVAQPEDVDEFTQQDDVDEFGTPEDVDAFEIMSGEDDDDDDDDDDPQAVDGTEEEWWR